MARIKTSDPTQCSMLSCWIPPANAGAPVGVIATTFTLDTALFEEECLARFADVQSDPLRDGALYRIEREEKLASLKCATVIADIHHCAGRRSLRWDLLAARPKAGVMHAKISLLVWEDHVRIIIASANLTNDGYRRNQEGLAVLDFNDKSPEPFLLGEALVYLRDILDTTRGPAKARASALLNWAGQRFPPGQAVPVRGIQRRLILLGPGRKHFFDQLSDILPSESPDQAHVVSPFFDPELRTSGPSHRLWAMMKKRGAAEVHFHVAGEASPETNGWRLTVPQHVLQCTPGGRPGVDSFVHPIAVTGVLTDSGPEQRPLHAKTLLLTHEKWVALVVGSSNFTSAGMGLNAHANNFEAGVVYLLRAPHNDRLRRMLETRVLRGGAAVAVSASTVFVPAIDADDAEGGQPPLPQFFSEALLEGADDDHYSLTLRFASPAPVGEWRIVRDDAGMYSSAEWDAASRPEVVRLILPRSGPPPSVLNVAWSGGAHQADWPVNIRTAQTLPAPDELKGLSLAALLELLSSARPLHIALRAWMRRQPDDDDYDVDQAVELVDPHAKVDTSAYLVKRVQRACWAMRSLKERLDSPVHSPAAMAWRIRGPVGAYALIDAMLRDCDPRLPDESAFLLCELWRELSSIRLADSGPGSMEVDAESREMLADLVNDLLARVSEHLPLVTDAMRDYIGQAMAETEACDEAA